MNYKELLKKYWFVMLVGVLLIVFVCVWSTSESKNVSQENESTIKTKQVDGKYLLFELDGKSGKTADDFYNILSKQSDSNLVLDGIFTAVAEKEIPLTENIKTMASNAAQYYIINNTEEELEDLMRTNGLKKYGNITTFFQVQYRNQMLLNKYLTENTEEIVVPYIKDNNLKKISHILVKVANVTEETDENGETIHIANPTEEETNKLNQVLAALKEKTFSEVAIEFSEDGSAADGGFLMYGTDSEAESQYVKEFADTVKLLSYGEQSEVITSQYGYHIILVEEPLPDVLINDQNGVNKIANAENGKVYLNMLNHYIEKYNIEIIDENIQEVLDSAKEVEEETETEADTTQESEENE